MPKLDQKGIAPVLLLMVIGVISFIAISFFLSFKNKHFSSIFPKPYSQASTSLEGLPDTTENMHFALISNTNVGTDSDKSEEAGKVDFVWGAEYFSPLVKQPPYYPGVSGVHSSMYRVFHSNGNSDINLATRMVVHYSANYYFAKHPDWLLYEDVSKSYSNTGLQKLACSLFACSDPNDVFQTLTPYTYRGNSYQRIFDGIPLDLSNPEVQRFIYEKFVHEAKDFGYDGAGFDNTTTLSMRRAKGIYEYNFPDNGAPINVTLSQSVSASPSTPATVVKVNKITNSLQPGMHIAVGGTDNMLGSDFDTYGPNADFSHVNMEYVEILRVVPLNSNITELDLCKPIYNSSGNETSCDSTTALIKNHALGEPVGRWKVFYSGQQLDDNYRQSYKQAFSYIMTRLKNEVGKPFSITINNGFGPYYWRTDLKAWEDLLPWTDLILDEGGFDYGNPPALEHVTSDDTRYPIASNNPWLTKMQGYQSLESKGKGVVLIDIVPYEVDNSDPTKQHITKADIQWNLSNYLLLKGSHSYQALLTGTNQYSGPIYKFWLPEYEAPIGHPVIHTGNTNDLMYQIGGTGCYARDYSNGLVIVNPKKNTQTTCTTLTPGEYRDLYNNPVTTVTLDPHSGIILLNSLNAISTNSLIGQWKFDDRDSLATVDSSGNFLNGSLVNGPISTTAGKFNRALSFNAASKTYVRIVNNSNLNPQNLTVECWVNPSVGSVFQNCLSKSQNNTNNEYELYLNQTDKAVFLIGQGSTSRTVASTDSLPLNIWTHLAGTYDGTFMKLYVNGQLKNSTNLTLLLTDTGQPLVIGTRNTTGTSSFSGLIDDVRVYNYARTQAQILSDMFNGVPPSPTPTPSIAPLPTPTASSIPGDLTGDGKVDVLDYGVFAGDFRDHNLRSDFNHDGVINILDYGLWVDYYRQANGIH